MTERELRRALREFPVPGEREAAERTLRVLRAAHAERAAAPPRRRGALRPALALALVLAALATAMTPAGAEVRRWIGDRFDSPPSPTLSRLPAGGRLLVTSSAGTTVVDRDGKLRRLGDYSDAGWSPRGLFVVATSGRRVYAVEPDGTVRWSIARPGVVAHPAWSLGDGFRVAYLEGGDLRVVIGNGAGDRRIARGVAPVTPSWRPGAGHVLTYATREGRLVSRDVDGGRTLWSVRTGEAPYALQWARGGRRLVTLGPAGVRSYDRAGRPGVGTALPRDSAGDAMAVHPSGSSVATAGAGDGVVIVSLRGGDAKVRRLFDGQGRFSSLAWSPTGRWLLAGWRDADQWVFIRAPGTGRGSAAPRRVVTFSNIAEQLDPGGTGPGRFPRVDGWCC